MDWFLRLIYRSRQNGTMNSSQSFQNCFPIHRVRTKNKQSRLMYLSSISPLWMKLWPLMKPMKVCTVRYLIKWLFTTTTRLRSGWNAFPSVWSWPFTPMVRMRTIQRTFLLWRLLKILKAPETETSGAST